MLLCNMTSFFPFIIFHLCIVLGCSLALAKLDISAAFHTVLHVKFIIKRYLIILSCPGRAGDSKHNRMKTNMSLNCGGRTELLSSAGFLGISTKINVQARCQCSPTKSQSVPVPWAWSWADPCARGWPYSQLSLKTVYFKS